jgi:hypothetical protein
MNIRFSIEKDGKIICSNAYEIKSADDWKEASADIWRRARKAQPLAKPNPKQFLSGLDDLWGATMKLDKA